MYDPDVENIYILYSTQMILEATKTSYEYDKPIFDEPLPNAKFDENYQAIDTSWQRNFSMTPLFVATQERSQVGEIKYLDDGWINISDILLDGSGRTGK